MHHYPMRRQRISSLMLTPIAITYVCALSREYAASQLILYIYSVHMYAT